MSRSEVRLSEIREILSSGTGEPSGYMTMDVVDNAVVCEAGRIDTVHRVFVDEFLD